MAITLGGQGTSVEMNVTPLIDVLLVLLIINMILLPHTFGEKALIPQKSTDEPPKPPEKTIVLQLQETGEGQRPTLKINEQDVTWDGLEARLHEIYSLRMEKVIFVKGDPEVDFQYVADVIDVSHHAGVLQIGLMGSD
jgi:biopolymer transport protein ExbD